ncbi:MAG: DeoR/GlpR transcriptional regulator [Erysipelotrichia bacterium]|nr:DeoR/GlpR transcriptional regulator [Erysipelotrichia bacterium]NCC53968.1 DeoR/GlpR transcriptional regulator [Erysipelotrichia bacterium]
MAKTNDERRLQIEKLLYQQEKLNVLTLANDFQVSAETIRNDLSFLEEKGILYRTHGGATLRGFNIDMPMDIRLQENKEKKRKIAEAAIHFIKNDMLIYIDPSSTALYLGKLLRLRKNITVITNSLDLADLLRDSEHKIYLLGGELSKQGKRTVGEYTLKMLACMYFDLCIFGMDGCLGIDGPANMIGDELAMNQLVLQRSKQAILLSDQSKFSRTAHFQYAPFQAFDALICDYLTKEDKERINIDKIIEVDERKE